MQTILTIDEACRCIQPGETQPEFIRRHGFAYAYLIGKPERAEEYADFCQGAIVQHPEGFGYWNHATEFAQWLEHVEAR